LWKNRSKIELKLTLENTNVPRCSSFYFETFKNIGLDHFLGCGKSSLAYLIANNEVLTNAPYTIGCSAEVKLHEFKEDTSSQKTFFIEFFDIGGSLSHKNSRGVFYQQVNGIILVHDLTNRKSHENLKNWLLEIINKESGKDTIKASFADQAELDSEQFLGSCQVSLAANFTAKLKNSKDNF
jgi:Rab-like protein 3